MRSILKDKKTALRQIRSRSVCLHFIQMLANSISAVHCSILLAVVFGYPFMRKIGFVFFGDFQLSS